MSEIISPDLAINGSIPIKQSDVSKQLDLLPKNYVAPIYKLRRFQQVSGGNSLTLGTNVTLSQFNIPGTSIWNYSRSFITADLTIAAAANYTNILTDSIPIDSIQLITNSGEVLAYIQNAQVYCKSLRFMCTSLKDYLSRGPVWANESVTLGLNSINYGCQPCDRETWDFDYASTVDAKVDTTLDVQTQITPNRPTGLHILDTNMDAAAVASFSLPNYDITAIANPPTDSATEAFGLIGVGIGATLQVYDGWDIAGPIALTTQTPAMPRLVPKLYAYNDCGKRSAQRLISSGDNDPIVIRCRFDLSAFIGTIFACDRDFYFGQNLQLNIYWKSLAQLGFISDVTSVGGQGPIAAATSLQNYYLFLSEDIDKANVSMMKNQVETAGIEMLVPYTLCNQLTAGAEGPLAATQFSFSSLLTPGSGLALKRIVTVPVSGLNAQGLTSDTSNLAYATNASPPVITTNSKWTQLQSFIDGNPLQDQILVDANGDVWNFMYPMIKNSPCGMSVREFHLNQFFVDNFSDCDDGPSIPENDCKESGLKIDFGRTYQLNITVVQGLILFQYQTWVRKLIIKPSGIQWGV